jgi:hypothetical protein
LASRATSAKVDGFRPGGADSGLVGVVGIAM